MTSPKIKIHNSDTMTENWISVHDDRVKIFDASDDWSWVLVRSNRAESLPLPVLVSASGKPEWSAVGEDGGRSTTAFFHSPQDELCLKGFQDSDRIICFVGALRKQLADFVNGAAPVDREALAHFLASICIGDAPAWQKIERFSDSSRFDLLHGCSALARRLGLYHMEVALIERALTIRRSRNLTRLLSYAYANAQDYPRAKEIAASSLEMDPRLENGPFLEHLGELRAFSDVGTELKSFSTTDQKHDTAIGSKIAYCLHNSQPFAQGGYAMRSHALAEAIVAEGQELVAFARPGFPSDGHAPSLKPMGCETSGSIDYYFENGFGRKGSAYDYIAKSAAYFERVFRAHEIRTVHAATNFWTALPAAIAAHRLAVPFVYEVRSFWTDTREARMPGFSKKPQAKRDDTLEAIVLALADEVITLNPAMRDKLMAMGLERERITIVPNCVDPKKYAPKSTDPKLAERYDIGEQDIIIGYLGAMLGYEGLDLLIDAVVPLIHENRHIKMLLIGADTAKFSDPSSIESELHHQIERLKLEDNVRLLPRIPPEEGREIYNLFDICAYPRRGFEVCERVSPLKPLEAMAAGKTVIASDVGGLLDMVSHDATGLVFEREDVSALRSTLARAISDGGLRQRLGESAREFVRRERNWEDAAKAVVAIYKRAGCGTGYDKNGLASLVAGHFSQ